MSSRQEFRVHLWKNVFADSCAKLELSFVAAPSNKNPKSQKNAILPLSKLTASGFLSVRKEQVQ